MSASVGRCVLGAAVVCIAQSFATDHWRFRIELASGIHTGLRVLVFKWALALGLALLFPVVPLYQQQGAIVQGLRMYGVCLALVAV